MSVIDLEQRVALHHTQAKPELAHPEENIANFAPKARFVVIVPALLIFLESAKECHELENLWGLLEFLGLKQKK